MAQHAPTLAPGQPSAVPPLAPPVTRPSGREEEGALTTRAVDEAARPILMGDVVRHLAGVCERSLGAVMMTSLWIAPTLLALHTLFVTAVEGVEALTVVNWLIPEPGWAMVGTSIVFATAYRIKSVRRVILLGWLIDRMLSFTPAKGIFPIAWTAMKIAGVAYQITPSWVFEVGEYVVTGVGAYVACRLMWDLHVEQVCGVVGLPFRLLSSVLACCRRVQNDPDVPS